MAGTEQRYGPKPAPAERLLLGAGLVLRLCQTHVIQHGVTYKQICQAAQRLQCTHTDHSKGVRAAATPSTVRAVLSHAAAPRQMGTYIMDQCFDWVGAKAMNACAAAPAILPRARPRVFSHVLH